MPKGMKMFQEREEKRDFLVSIKPTYASKILSGQKTVELRRRFPTEIAEDAIVIIYSTSPVRAIVGYARIKTVIKLPIDDIWRTHGNAACIEKQDFFEYFSGLEYGFVIVLGSVQRFQNEVKASDIHQKFGFVAPQSYRYLPVEYYGLMEDERVQVSNRYKRHNRPRRSAAC